MFHRHTQFDSLKNATLIWFVFLTATSTAQDEIAVPQEQPNGTAKPAMFLTIGSPVNDAVFGTVTNAATTLQNEAVKRNQQAILVLEITPGTSQFHHVQGLAKFLTSSKLSQVTTVAWIPKTVTGNNVVTALACNEIVMHPDAELGDISRGDPIDGDEKNFIRNLVEKRHNRKLTSGLVEGMYDRQAIVLKITTQNKNLEDVQVVTQEEARRIRDLGTPILKTSTIKEAGVPGSFSGVKARNLDVLIVQTAESRAEITDIYKLPREAMREHATLGKKARVSWIKIDDFLEPILISYVERHIQQAIDEGANLIVFEIDSPGGFIEISKNLSYTISELDPKQVRTVAYIPRQAISAAAIIALGCDEIYMHKGAKIGDAGVIFTPDGQAFERAPEKVVSFYREAASELAKRNDRPEALAMAMVDKDLLVYEVTHRETGQIWYLTEEQIAESKGEWIKGPLVFESKDEALLIVDGERAHELKLAEPPVNETGQAGIEELKIKLGIPAEDAIKVAGRNWVDTLIFILNTKAAMFWLIVLAVICIYIELHMMVGLFGIVAVLCLAIFFWSRVLGGTAGWLEVILFLLGLFLLVIEIFILPGFGVFGLSGGLLILASMILASQTFGDYGPTSDLDRLSGTIGTLAGAVVSVVVVAVLISRFLPEIPFLRGMILSPDDPIDGPDLNEPRLPPEIAGEGSAYQQELKMLGKRGNAITTLRPAGKAEIEGEYLDVVSDGPYIERGQAVEVVQIKGRHIVVRQV